MNRRVSVGVAVFSTAIAVLLSDPRAPGQQLHADQPDMKSAFTTADFSVLPAMPGGKSTVMGGQITNIDPVLDQFTLRVSGQRPMKILFDERTQVYRNGTKVPLRDLRAEQHASVQTVLEGPNVFAISIHTLSDVPQGEMQGRVLDYNAATKELSIGSSLSREPIRFLLRDDSAVVREGQGTFTSASAGQADLVRGALVTVTFRSEGRGEAVASHITVLAKPGSEFVFSGKLSALDVHAGTMVLVDPRDQKSYQIAFDPGAQSVTSTLHVGDQVRVNAAFDGVHYTAVDITPTESTQP